MFHLQKWVPRSNFIPYKFTLRDFCNEFDALPLTSSRLTLIEPSLSIPIANQNMIYLRKLIDYL